MHFEVLPGLPSGLMSTFKKDTVPESGISPERCLRLKQQERCLNAGLEDLGLLCAPEGFGND
jgi:hypothetical protein